MNAPKPPEIGILLCDRANAFWADMERAYDETASDEGLCVECVFPRGDGERDRDAQSAVMREMIGRGYDALVVNPLDERNLASAILEAAEADVTVFDVGPKCALDTAMRAGERYVPVRIADFAGQGRAAASAVLRRIGGGAGTVVLVAGRDAAVHSRLRVRGMDDVFASVPSVRRVIVSGEFKRAPARDVAMRILESVPDVVAFCCANDEMALGVSEVLTRNGRKSDVAVAGIDGIPEAIGAIRDGRLDLTVALRPEMVAGRVLRRVRSFFAGVPWNEEELFVGDVIPDDLGAEFDEG